MRTMPALRQPISWALREISTAINDIAAAALASDLPVLHKTRERDNLPATEKKRCFAQKLFSCSRRTCFNAQKRSNKTGSSPAADAVDPTKTPGANAKLSV